MSWDKSHWCVMVSPLWQAFSPTVRLGSLLHYLKISLPASKPLQIRAENKTVNLCLYTRWREKVSAPQSWEMWTTHGEDGERRSHSSSSPLNSLQLPGVLDTFCQMVFFCRWRNRGGLFTKLLHRAARDESWSPSHTNTEPGLKYDEAFRKNLLCLLHKAKGEIKRRIMHFICTVPFIHIMQIKALHQIVYI